MSATKPIERTIQYVRRKGIVRPRDLEALGIPREYLLRLHRQGNLPRQIRNQGSNAVYALDGRYPPAYEGLGPPRMGIVGHW